MKRVEALCGSLTLKTIAVQHGKDKEE